MSKGKEVAIVLLVALSGSFAIAADRPNVLIFFTDDQGTLDANCYGSRDLYTPNIDELAATGVRFTQAYAHTVCCPSRALLLTGRHPQRSNINTWAQSDAHAEFGTNMDLAEVTLAEAFKTAGYRTALFGKWHLGAALTHGPTKQGFDEFFGIRDGFIENYTHFYLHREGFHDLYRGTEEVFMRGKYFPDLMVDETLKFLDRQSQNEPFFLYVAFNIPHYPEQADSRFEERYTDLPMPRRSYAKMISTADDRIGKVMMKLETRGFRDNTIIVFMSDNGHSAEKYSIKIDDNNSGFPKGYVYGALGGGGNTGKWRGHKGTFFEGGLRTPSIISYPKRLPSNVVREQAISIADYYPTLLELCGVEKPDVKLDGASILPIIESADTPSHHKVFHWQWFDKWAVREGDWKLINTPSGNPKQDRFFLASLSDDEPEQKNHAVEKPALVARLRKLHDAWSDDVF